MKSAPYLNPDPYCRFIGPKNLGKVLIDGELTTCLLDNGAQINFVTPTYARQRGMDIMSLNHLANSSNSWDRGYHGGTRKVCHDECSGTLH